MIDAKSLRGVFSPVVTPFRKDLAPDQDRKTRGFEMRDLAALAET